MFVLIGYPWNYDNANRSVQTELTDVILKQGYTNVPTAFCKLSAENKKWMKSLKSSSILRYENVENQSLSLLHTLP